MLVAVPVISAPISREETERHQQAIQSTIDAFKTDDIEAIAKKVQFPLARRYPLPPVNNAKDFGRRYTEIFDSTLGKLIATSNAKIDWENVGWRGYMLKRGLVWADEDGRIIGINHESRREQTIRAGLIEADRNALHQSLRTFDEPELKWDTKNYRLRIDALGKDHRLAVWPAGRDFESNPLLIIELGTLTFDGSGGNHHYSFPLGKKVYVCDVTVLGNAREHCIGSFALLMDEKILFSEEALKDY